MKSLLYRLSVGLPPALSAFGMLGAIPCEAQVYEQVYVFSNAYNASFEIPGNSPRTPLLQGLDGNFYGTLHEDGASFQGSVFRMTPAGQLTTLVNFDGITGSRPKSGLIQGSDGSLFGTASGGGSLDQGTVFRVAIDGEPTVRANFGGSNSGSNPETGLVAGGNGFFYGTTTGGGTDGLGTVFRIATNETGGAAPTLVSFTGNGSSNKGSRPRAAMITDGSGNIYGTTSEGGTFGHGTVFRMTLTGTLSTIANFTGNGAADKGSRPTASLVFGGDGYLYGTTSEGGTNGHGTVFRLPSSGGSGQVTTLLNFTGKGGPERGSRPEAGLLLGGDGNFYGTTSEGGVYGFGTVFQMTPAGILSTVFDFREKDGRPRAPLVAATDGALYGTTSGPPGVVYRLVFPGKPKFIARKPLIDSDKAFLQISMNPAGSATNVFLEYGTDGINFPTKLTVSENLIGTASTTLGTLVRNLIPSTTYYYRFSATNSAGTQLSDVQVFTTESPLEVLSLLQQSLPTPPPQPFGFNTTINLSPIGVGAWRFVGEPSWRTSGVPAGANRSGSHVIEFRPVPGYTQPQPEFLPEATANNVISRTYVPTPESEGGSLAVTIKPDGIVATNVPAADRAQWRLLGESYWRDSGAAVASLVPGTHLIEFKPVSGRITPDPVAVAVEENNASTLTITYFPADVSTGTAPQPVPFASVANDPNMPYAFVGQIRSDGSSGSGFVVRHIDYSDNRSYSTNVVATAAHLVFDDATLAAVTGVKFLFQRDSSAYEPVPLVPRASYVLQNYASKRSAENTPGSLSLSSLDSNVATIYFTGNPITTMYPGYLGSDAVENPFLLSSAKKILIGYPLDGGIPANLGLMHATSPTNVNLTHLFGRSYTTNAIRGGHGMAGAPLFVEQTAGEGNAYFPAAIHVGSYKGQTVLRAIDSEVIELFKWADRIVNDGEGPPTPGATLVSLTGNLSNTDPGSLKVNIEPVAARTAGAGWSLDPETTLRLSGSQKNGLAPGNYTVKLKALSGFFQPSDKLVSVNGGQLTTLTYTYQTITPLDTWRFGNFGTYENTGDAADGNDFDKDGLTNISEYTAGSNPKDSGDFFRIATTAKSGNTFTTTCAGKAGRSYTLMRNTDLSGAWTRLGSQGPLTGDGSVTLTDTSSPPDKAFYRIEVVLP